MEHEPDRSMIKVFLLRREPTERTRAEDEDDANFIVYAELRDGVYRILRMTQLNPRDSDKLARVV